MTLKQKIKHLIYTRSPLAGKMNYFGSSLHFPKESHLFYRLCCEGIYECDLINELVSLLPPDGVMLDIGANIGLTALPTLAQRNNAQVFSFEPSPSSFSYLQETHRNSPYKSRWGLFNLALSNTAGDMQFYTFGEANSAFDGFADNHRLECKEPSKKVTVEAETLDNWVSQQQLERIDLIKIDVEGFESDVLSGAQRTISSFSPVILLEWSDSNLTPDKSLGLVDIALELEMELFSIPEYKSISTRTELWLNMRETQDFVLMPSR